MLHAPFDLQIRELFLTLKNVGIFLAQKPGLIYPILKNLTTRDKDSIVHTARMLTQVPTDVCKKMMLVVALCSVINRGPGSKS